MRESVRPVIPATSDTLESIGSVIADIPVSFGKPIIIANCPGECISKYLTTKESNGELDILRINHQVGKAEAMRRGIEYALLTDEFEHILQLDGRGKQPSYQAAQMYSQIKSSNAEMVIANRYENLDHSEQSHRSSISRLFSSFVYSICGLQFKDSVCGTRLYTKSLAESFTESRSFGYGWELEQLFIASKKNVTVIDFPVLSNRQADATNAEKIEDNLFAIIAWCGSFSADPDLKEQLCYALVMIKKRLSFDIVFSTSDTPKVNFHYVGNGTISDGYSNQKLIDAYKISTHQGTS